MQQRRTLVLVSLFLLLAVMLTASVSVASSTGRWMVEGYTLPHAKWTPGCIKGYNEGDFVPHRVVQVGFVPGQPERISFWDDYQTTGKSKAYGFDYSTSFGVIGGVLNGVTDNGFVSAQNATKHKYTVDFTPDGSTREVIVSWFGHLAVTTPGKKGASWWPGATLDTRIAWRDPTIPGERTLPHQVNKAVSTGGLEGYKWLDALSVNGRWDPGEPGLPDWMILLYDQPTMTLVAWTLTGPDGYWEFLNLLQGTYVVKEVNPPTWMQTAPPGGVYYVVTVPPSVTGLNFGDWDCNLGTDQSRDFWVHLGYSRYSQAQMQAWLDAITAESSLFGPMSTADMVNLLTAAGAPGATAETRFKGYYLVVLLNRKSGILLDADLVWVGWQDTLGFFSHEVLYVPQVVAEVEALGGTANAMTLADLAGVMYTCSWGLNVWRPF